MAGNSIYALMALKGAKNKYFIDICDLHSKQHTAKNIFSEIKTSLKSKQLEFDQLSAVVTDSPSISGVHIWIFPDASLVSLRNT
jgi:hypothetical protein